MNPLTKLLSNVRSLVFGNNNQQQREQEQNADMSLDHNDEDDDDAWGGIGMKNDGDDDDDNSSLGPASDYENEVEFDYVYRSVVAGETPEQVQRMIDLVAEGSDARRRSAVNAAGRHDYYDHSEVWRRRPRACTRDETPLQAAHRLRRANLVGLLVMQGAEAKGLEGFGSDSRVPSLALVASYGLVSDLRKMLRRGRDANKKFSCAPSWNKGRLVSDCTAAHVCVSTPATMYGQPPAAEDLLLCLRLLVKEGGGDPNARDSNGETPIFWACHPGCRDPVATLDFLLESGANVSRVFDNRGRSLLMAAAGGEHPDKAKIVRYVLDNKLGSADDRNHVSGGNALHALAGHAHGGGKTAGVCDMLLDQGAAVNLQDKNGRTPLLLAARHGHMGMVLALLKRGADASATDPSDGSTVLMAVCGCRFKTWTHTSKAIEQLVRFTPPAVHRALRARDRKSALDLLIEVEVQEWFGLGLWPFHWQPWQ
jgi:hypothetical protein